MTESFNLIQKMKALKFATDAPAVVLKLKDKVVAVTKLIEQTSLDDEQLESLTDVIGAIAIQIAAIESALTDTSETALSLGGKEALLTNARESIVQIDAVLFSNITEA